MAKKVAVRKRTAKPASPKKPSLAVSIDYPPAAEAVRPGHYSIRVTAAGAAQAQVRLDGGEWRECREAVGHFWLDWAPALGAVAIEARARGGKGRWAAAPARRAVVVPL